MPCSISFGPPSALPEAGNGRVTGELKTSQPTVQRELVRPLVSVIITNFRVTEDVLVALDAVQAVAEADEFTDAVEIIVVDNASTPSSASLIGGHSSRPRVIAIQDNLGRAKANNVGAAESSSDFLAFFNPSTRPRAGWLRHALRPMVEDDSIGCVASTVLDWDEERIDSAGGELMIGSLPAPRLSGEPANRSATDLDVLFAPATSMIIRRRTFDDIGGFDGAFYNAGEDLDLCWRLWSTGRRVRLAARSVVAHRQQGVLDELGSWHRTFAGHRGALGDLQQRRARLPAATPRLDPCRGGGPGHQNVGTVRGALRSARRRGRTTWSASDRADRGGGDSRLARRRG